MNLKTNPAPSSVSCHPQLPHRRVTFSTANQAQDLQDASQHSYYDSGLEESETPSSKSSSGPRIGPLALPEDHYERTTPDGSIGEMEHPENGKTRWSFPSLYSSSPPPSIHQSPRGADTHTHICTHPQNHINTAGFHTHCHTLFSLDTHLAPCVKMRRVSRNINLVFLIRFPQFPALCIPSLKRCVTPQQRNTINMQHNQLPRLNELTSQLCKSY